MSMFRPEELKERKNRDGSVSIFPTVGGRLRIAHETNDQLSITTELVSHVPMEGATMKAMVTTPKGLFSAYGAASATKDQRLVDSLLELAETRAIARSLRFAGYGVEYTGNEELGADDCPTPPVQTTPVRPQQQPTTKPLGQPSPHPAADDFVPMTRAQKHAIEVICKVNNWPVLDSIRRILRQPDLSGLDDLSKDEASTVISKMKETAAKAA